MSFLRCADRGVRTALLALTLPLGAVGCLQFEEPLPAVDDAEVDSSSPGKNDGGTSQLDAGDEQDADLDAGEIDAELQDADQPEASVDSAVRDAAVPIPKRPTLTKCGFGPTSTVTEVKDTNLNEVSGVAGSRRNARIVWMVEDSGNGSSIHAVNDLGVTVATYAVAGSPFDIEDMAIGPGPSDGEWYLYIADIGDNNGSRTKTTIFRVLEPQVAWNQAPVSASLTAEPLHIRYPNGARHNAEAVMIDPNNQDLYVITKDGFTLPNNVFKLPAPQVPFSERELEYVAPVWGGLGTDLAVTSADISADGRRILVRTLKSATHYLRAPGASIADTLKAGTPCEAEMADELKGESIGFGVNAAGKIGYYTISEGVLENLHFVTLPNP